MQILILGGTRDAMTLADQLLDHPELQPIYSLAGRTRRPCLPRCQPGAAASAASKASSNG